MPLRKRSALVLIAVSSLVGVGTEPAWAAKPAVFQCNDGIDNDADGLTDTADPGCKKKNKKGALIYNKHGRAERRA